MVKLFTHTDLDGVGCAILAKLAFGEALDIEYCNYDDVDKKVAEYACTCGNKSVVHITDISVKEDVAEMVQENFEFKVLLDHHPTALNLNKLDFCTVKISDEETKEKTSGTEMYYKYLITNHFLESSDVLDIFVELVRNYDTWRWSTLGDDGLICKQVNDLYYLYGRDKFITWAISEIWDEVFPRLYVADELVLDIKQKEIDSYVEEKDKKMFTSPMCGYVCGFVFAEKYFSELGNRLCTMHPEIDFVAMIDMDGTISYRTVKENIDLGNDVAKLFGGGGHPKAAGSQFSHEVKMKLIENIFI